jgi:hypothetical protein
MQGIEILTGVLEATVRDPSGSGPGTRLSRRLEHPSKRRRRQATRPHFHARVASPEGRQRTVKCFCSSDPDAPDELLVRGTENN